MLPELFCERMKDMLGEEYAAFLDSYEQDRYQALRINPLKKSADGARITPEQLPFSLKKVPWAEDGYYYGKEEQPGKHPYHQAGLYYIQEPSAMAPVTLLGVQPGERILDLCAAPGGKSTQIAAALQGQGLLICNEIHPARAKILSENVERMGVVNACVTNETPERLAEVFSEYFDRILVDAPCSGEGMFRKNEDACGEWSPENVRLCAERQDHILKCAARMLRPGGRLVYSTCTFAPLENEGSISRFVAAHPEFHILPAEPVKSILRQQALRLGNGIAEWTEAPAPHLEDALHLWPQFVAGEGHFAAVLEKDGNLPEGYMAVPSVGLERSASEKELGDYTTFVREELSPELQKRLLGNGCCIKFGDHIYWVTEGMPAVKGLKVLRPGLHMGTLKKNRFEPAHALALALAPGETKHMWDLSSQDDSAKAYLCGQTFSAEGEKGWYLICVDGFSMGWGKLAGSVMKNHYPKGLRCL
ncbi:MAG: RsmB/NOP family class I SAM-dependent RNA methyltransferase [Acetatifactor sp.]|nr:RsmB/NOP family class I SAM-dependent RNA methyltransferase [Acetatifactor sp.]